MSDRAPCRICMIVKDYKLIVGDSKGDVANALVVCYCAGFAESTVCREAMTSTFCSEHAAKLLGYAVNTLKAMVDGALAQEEPKPSLTPPPNEDLN